MGKEIKNSRGPDGRSDHGTPGADENPASRAGCTRGRKGGHEKVLSNRQNSGYVRVMIDGSQYELSEEITLDKNLKHNISIIVDRLVVKPDIEKRLTDSVENVLDLADGLLVVDTMDGNQLNFSQSFSCPDCGISMEEIEPRSFFLQQPVRCLPGAVPDLDTRWSSTRI